MCLKPQPPQPIPPDTKALVGPILDEDTVYRFVGDVLFEQFHDEDFADLYPNDGQPALSPVLLSFVLIFQALEDLSDRATAFAVTFNVAWKYALHLPLAYPGFDPTVLSEFRQRILTHDAESRLFTAVFAQLKQLGFFKRKGIQRTDSIAILTHHRLLKRIELCVDTMRTTIKSLVHHDPAWATANLPAEWEERYARRCKTERMKEEERQTLSGVVGDDGQWLLERLQQDDAEYLRELRAVSTLRDVWAVHYERCADGHMRWREGGERGGSQAIETPYDPDAHWATKRSKDWVGYKLHVTETDDADKPHLITDIAITPAPEYDGTALPAIRERQAARENLPGERYADSAYISGEHIVDGRTLGEDLIGPMRETVTPQSSPVVATTLAAPPPAGQPIKAITFEGGSLTGPSGADSVSGTGIKLVTDAGGNTWAWFDNTSSGYLTEDFTGVDNLFVSFYLKVNKWPATDARIALISNAGTTVGNIVLRSTGRLRLRVGSTTIGAETAPLAIGTVYRVGLHQKKGSGGNAVLEGFLAQGNQAFGAPFAATSTGTWTSQANRLRFGATNGSSIDATFDDIKLDGAAMPGML